MMAGSLILIVDDHEGVRSLLRSVLEPAGYRVAEAANGRQAVELFRREGADLVMMDLVMPEQEGIETIKALRTESPDLPIIAMSGAFGGDYLKVARLLGASDVLQKPFDMAGVLKCVRKHLPCTQP